MDNFCEGCGVRNTGENFSHPGLCKSCMGAMMETPTAERNSAQCCAVFEPPESRSESPPRKARKQHMGTGAST